MRGSAVFATPYGEHSRKYRLTLFVLLGWLSALAPLATDAYLPALPQLSDDLGGSASTTLLTFTFCLLGLAAGQLLIGTLSDAYGRRRPLLAGLGLYVVMSLLCAVAPSIWPLYLFVLLQCFGGAAGVVIARAIARDLFSGVVLARFFARLILIIGIAPILGPILGAQILRFTSWRGVFVALAILGAALTMCVALLLPETLPPEARRRERRGATLALIGGLVRDAPFRRSMLVIALAFGAFGAYLSGSSFVLQEVYGTSAQEYAFAFAANAVVIVVTAQVARVFVARVGSWRLLWIGLVLAAVAGLGTLIVVLAHADLVWLLLFLFVLVPATGALVLPNTYAIALEEHPAVAGTASALLGTTQFVAGGIAAPIVGLAGKDSAVPMGIVIAALAIANLVQFSVFARVRLRAAHA